MPKKKRGPLEPGVYFDLDIDEYHADPALGSGNLRKLLRSGPDYWFESPMNPDRPENKVTPARIKGQAIHLIVLEGKQAFDGRFVCEPTGDDVLYTVGDIKEWLTEHGVLFPKGQKPELVAQAKAVARELKVQVTIYDDFKASAEKDGKLILSHDEYSRAMITSAMITKNPELSPAFEGGASEVSVFWEGPGGVMMKCRFDYLKQRGISDLKSITNTLGIPFRTACRTAFARYRYDIQAEHYLAGRNMLAPLVREGRVFGDHDADWLKRVAAAKEFAMVYVFFQAEGAPITWGFNISPSNPLLSAAARDVGRALDTYNEFLKRFGRNEMWLLAEKPEELSVDELPAYFGRD
jgi:hypothetical protein